MEDVILVLSTLKLKCRANMGGSEGPAAVGTRRSRRKFLESGPRAGQREAWLWEQGVTGRLRTQGASSLSPRLSWSLSRKLWEPEASFCLSRRGAGGEEGEGQTPCRGLKQGESVGVLGCRKQG